MNIYGWWLASNDNLNTMWFLSWRDHFSTVVMAFCCLRLLFWPYLKNGIFNVVCLIVNWCKYYVFFETKTLWVITYDIYNAVCIQEVLNVRNKPCESASKTRATITSSSDSAETRTNADRKKAKKAKNFIFLVNTFTLL